ncbi:hypothetical protein GCM10010346_16230 [Streptomyces chryseus]|uniref:Uncharacterized protein n=1 Tax=Streptomyces chryseus TaxID=68186 RepID=A0ABQ3DGY3_9ACTN|nr:hypothetical protein GCM10010346_16230 [Streptomyces chryseus]
MDVRPAGTGPTVPGRTEARRGRYDAFVMMLLGACVVALVAVIARARVEIARIDAKDVRRGADGRR